MLCGHLGSPAVGCQHVMSPVQVSSPVLCLRSPMMVTMDRSVVDRWLQCGAASRPPVTLNEYSCSPVTVLRRVPACSAAVGTALSRFGQCLSITFCGEPQSNFPFNIDYNEYIISTHKVLIHGKRASFDRCWGRIAAFAY